ncbi:hypothetical protein [Clostridium grantii]|uniref:HEAT repeat-containing protein n=1 Tax=Clostridium grantii DSM 8605 TaxID=1121316 RepID=A0A1M5VN47_9CLOT|nr:hypothetical protein [Clostridium grantii]SHH76657.1 hypothetical protein SAMN02745207_02378 [Clostridium grantii DSM 8605]
MLRKSKVALSVMICLSLVSVAVKAEIISPNKVIKNSIVAKYLNKDEKEINHDLKQLNKKELINEFNSIAATVGTTNSIDVLIPFASVVFERKNEFEDSEIIEIIKDDTNSIPTQELMVDLYCVKNENKSSKNNLKKLLEENIRNEVKSKIVIDSEFTKNDVLVLKNLIEEDDGILAFHSLKKLSKTDVKESYEVSEKILANYKSQSKYKVSAAQKATVQYLKDKKSTNKDIKNKFISSCVEIYNTTDDSVLKDSSIFALSDLMDKEAVIEIINNESVDEELKMFAIDQNFMTLNEILLNNPTETDIETVIEAMEIMPIKDLVESLEKAKKYISNSELLKRCNDELKIMKLNGSKGNLKWLD